LVHHYLLYGFMFRKMCANVLQHSFYFSSNGGLTDVMSFVRRSSLSLMRSSAVCQTRSWCRRSWPRCPWKTGLRTSSWPSRSASEWMDLRPRYDAHSRNSTSDWRWKYDE